VIVRLRKGGQLYRLRKNSTGEARSVRARLKSCRKRRKIDVGFRPCGPSFGDLNSSNPFAAECSVPFMSKPSRPSDPADATGVARLFFVTTGTAGGGSLFQTERTANLFIEVLRSCIRSKRIDIQDFVVMPNHVHILMVVPGNMSLEKAVQLIKGRFSFRAKKKLGYMGEVWQRGFSDVRILDEVSHQRHRDYIDHNPAKAGLVMDSAEYRFGSLFLKKAKQAGVKQDTGKELDLI
jgi:putative transposase